MNVHLRRLALVGAASLFALAAGTAPAQAANEHSSCVGTIVSTQAREGVLDVNYFKALAEAEGSPTFGQFVATGAQLHEGSLEACLPG